MSPKNGLEKAPYRSNGDLMEYAYTPDSAGEWRENKPFRAKLLIEGTERGRSAARFIWRDEDNHRFPMFMADMVSLLQDPRSHIIGGTVDAWWIVQKRGKNYGVRVATWDECRAQPHTGGGEECPRCFTRSRFLMNTPICPGPETSA